MKKNELKTLWTFFSQINQIPRPSKLEQKMIEFLINFATERHLEYTSDSAGNLIITKAASNKETNSNPIALQAHMDMVCEKNIDSMHNFTTDPIITYTDGDWIKAVGTTLGADDGIGIAMILSILDSNDLDLPRLECLFTVDEETGLTGAKALQSDFLTSQSLINLDSEDDGEIFIGSAGGVDTIATFDINQSTLPSNYFGFSITLKGLKGGHSGDDIHRPLGNAIIILSQFLSSVNQETDLRIHQINGGNLRNAIPREASANIAIPIEFKEKLRVMLNLFIAELETMTSIQEPTMHWELESNFEIKTAIDSHISQGILTALSTCPNGVIKMSDHISELVETSTNIASIRTIENKIVIVSSQRSSIQESLSQISKTISNQFRNIGATVSHSDGYPGWEINLESPLLKLAMQSHQKLFQTPAKVKAIHAGLECGLFKEKFPDLDVISIGPTMRGVHSPDERLSIQSTEKTYYWLIDILQSFQKLNDI
jgi:dipeptidase D